MMAVYVHIPFCEKKCIYCAFASFSQKNEEIEGYFSKLLQEIENCEEDDEVQSIYFGGGTPSCVSEKYILSVMQKLREKFKISNGAEITIECNPSSTAPQKLKAYKKAGFNRISFGVQSLDDDMLKFLSRRHDSSGAISAINLAKSCGYVNISADLLLGLPSGDVLSDAQTLVSLGVKHISAYMLQIEDGTPLKSMVESGKVKLPSDDETINNYEKLVDFLQKNGLKRYEISNFSKNGYESRHNKAYWTGEKYVGFGLGAHSFDGVNVRKANASNFEDYYAGKTNVEHLSLKERDEEIIMLGLRCECGFDKNKLSFNIAQNKNFQLFKKEGVIFEKNGKVFLNPKFYGVSNSIILKLI